MSDYVLNEKELFLINHLKSIATSEDTNDELSAISIMAENFDEDGNDDKYLDLVIAYIKEHKNATVKEIGNYLESLLPPIEIVDDDEDKSA